jgi:hypothetical protein
MNLAGGARGGAAGGGARDVAQIRALCTHCCQRDASAYVVGTAWAAKHDFVRSLGADEVIDYTAVGIAAATGDIDIVVTRQRVESLAGAAASRLDAASSDPKAGRFLSSAADRH